MKKWKKKRTWTLAMTLVLLALLSLSACGSKLSNTSATAETMAAGYAMDVREAAITMAPAGEDLNGLKAESGSGLSPSPDIGSPGEAGRKLIRDVSMNVEARDFDGVLSQITDKVVESAGNVTSKQEQVTDVTLQYSDTESRKKSLEIEQERLWALLEKAESLDAVVALEARLSEIRYELESYTSQLRLYDNQVHYSTVSIYMREVKDLTPTAPDSIGTRIQKGFNRSLNNLGEAVTDLIVWLAVNSPILFVLAVIIGAVVLIVRRLSRKLRGGNRSPRRFSPFRGKPMGGKKGAKDQKEQAEKGQPEKEPPEKEPPEREQAEKEQN